MKPTHKDDLKYALSINFTKCNRGVSLYADVFMDMNNKKDIHIDGLGNFTKGELEIFKTLIKNIYDTMEIRRRLILEY